MNPEKIKFSIIIPTRERCDVLEWSLRSATSQKYDHLEIIVSDNYSDDNTESVVKSFKDKRIRYLNTGKRVSMSENWEFALSHVTDGWVTILGDDDALLPNAIEKVAALIKLTNTKAVRSSVCEYSWPGLLGAKNGNLGVPTKKGWEKRNANNSLAKVMQGRRSYTTLPLLYNGGFVDFSVLSEIKEKTGRFYGSCIPDVYSGCAISSVIEDYIYSYEPFAVNGASIHSNGTDTFTMKKKDENSPSNIFKREPNIPFHPDIPLNKDLSYPVSLQAIVYESYIQTKFLRLSSDFDNHQNQLEIILATSGAHAILVEEWGELFARKHKLNMPLALNNSRKLRRKIKLATLPEWISIHINKIEPNNNKIQMKNVYQTSIVASEALMNLKYSNKFKRIYSLFIKILQTIKN